MAQVKMNPVFVEVKGKVGDLVFKQYGEALVMARTPQVNGHEATPAQAEFAIVSARRRSTADWRWRNRRYGRPTQPRRGNKASR